MTSGTRQLSTDDDLSVVGGKARFAQDLPGRALGLHLEQPFDQRRLRLGPDDVGLGATAAQEQDSIDEDRLAGSRLATQHIEASLECHGDVLDHRQVTNAELAEHQSMLAASPRGLNAYLARRRASAHPT